MPVCIDWAAVCSYVKTTVCCGVNRVMTAGTGCTNSATTTSLEVRVRLSCPPRARAAPLDCLLPAAAVARVRDLPAAFVLGWMSARWLADASCAVVSICCASSPGMLTRSDARDGEGEESDEGDDELDEVTVSRVDDGGECTPAGHRFSSDRTLPPSSEGSAE